MSDPAATYENLKTETAEMFGYDLASLNLTQGLQIDLVALLRLEIDSMSGQVLAGQTVDLARLVAAHTMLVKLLPAHALVAPAPPAEVRFNTDHQRRLRDLVERVVMREDPGDPGEAARLADAQRREEACMQREAFSLPPEPVPAPATAAPVRPREAAATGTAPVLPGAVVTIGPWAR